MRKKLKSSRGTSLLFALALLTLAAVVSATILSAAVSAAARLSDDRTRQQNRLALTSAAELLRGELPGVSVTVRADRTTEITTDYLEDSSVTTVTYGVPAVDAGAHLNQTVGAALASAVETCLRTGAPPAAIEGSFPIDAGHLPRVLAAYRLTAANIEGAEPEENPGEAVKAFRFQLRLSLSVGKDETEQRLYLRPSNADDAVKTQPPDPLTLGEQTDCREEFDEEGNLIRTYEKWETVDETAVQFWDEVLISSSETQLWGADA